MLWDFILFLMYIDILIFSVPIEDILSFVYSYCSFWVWCVDCWGLICPFRNTVLDLAVKINVRHAYYSGGRIAVSV